MNENDFDRTARAWLEDGPTRMSDRALLSALEEIHATRQRRGPRLAWRTSSVSMFARVATAAVLVAGVGLLAVNVVQRLQGGPGVGAAPAPIATATASPSPAPSGSPEATFDLRLTKPFVSPTNGYSVTNIGRSVVNPATQPWTPPQPFVDNRGAARFLDWAETGEGAVFGGASTVIPAGVSVDDWIDQAVASAATTTTCMLPRARQAEISIDAQPARISAGCAHQFLATVVSGGRLYVFELIHGWDNEADARAFFDSWLATVRLTPETAVPPSSALPS